MKTNTDTNEVAEFCERHHACGAGRDFADRYGTMADVWDACERVDWLIWVYRRTVTPMDMRELRLFACWCVRETPLKDGRKVWDLLTDERSRNAVVVAERFARGEATDEERSRAADAAADAYAAYAYAYAYARKFQAEEFKRRFANPFQNDLAQPLHPRRVRRQRHDREPLRGANRARYPKAGADPESRRAAKGGVCRDVPERAEATC